MITASIVLYNSNINVLIDLIKTLQNSPINHIYLIDNSKRICDFNFNKLNKVIYIHNSNNIGYGAGHNIGIKLSIKSNAKFHFVINPDIKLESSIINDLINYIQSDKNIGMVMPQILNFDSTIQFLPKLLPSPLDIFKRKFSFLLINKNKFLDKYELRKINPKKPINVPILSGCFTLFNLEIISQIGFYDEKYFMYFEDWDLSRRMHKVSKTIYYPQVNVFHGYESGANKSFKLFKIYIISGIIYFFKWGWIFDNERKLFNNTALNQLGE